MQLTVSGKVRMHPFMYYLCYEAWNNSVDGAPLVGVAILTRAKGPKVFSSFGDFVCSQLYN
jgi:hypothetical protein